MKNYRDRAAERRKGDDGQVDEAELRAKMMSGYRAVPGTMSAVASVAERRRMEIQVGEADLNLPNSFSFQESKYLGGDIEHTHLVKGLDYSLLNKVRSEMEANEEAEELEQVYEVSLDNLS